MKFRLQGRQPGLSAEFETFKDLFSRVKPNKSCISSENQSNLGLCVGEEAQPQVKSFLLCSIAASLMII